MMSIDSRPRIRNAPFSRAATSPVRNHPPSANASAVASGRPQYSRNTPGPLTSSSPGSQPATSAPASVDQPHLNARERSADEARPALAVQRVRERHPDLGHAIALEERVARQRAPFLEDAGTGSAADPDTKRRSLAAPCDHARLTSGAASRQAAIRRV